MERGMTPVKGEEKEQEEESSSSTVAKFSAGLNEVHTSSTRNDNEQPSNNSTPTPIVTSNQSLSDTSETEKPSTTTVKEKVQSSSAINEDIVLAKENNNTENNNTEPVNNDVTVQRVVSALRGENNGLKAKISKLKNLLARSATAHKTLSSELNLTKTKLDEANLTISRLTMRCDHLTNRPTHLDMLADFEARFDAAILSIEKTKEQSGGEDSVDLSDVMRSSTTVASDEHEKVAFELNEARLRIETLLQRAAKLEQINENLLDERESSDAKMVKLESELRLRRETEEQMKKDLQQKSYELMEMQLEIDLVTKASLDANQKVTQSMEITKAAISEKEHVEELESQVTAFREWALASAEAKRLAVERSMELEKKLALLTNPKSSDVQKNDTNERFLWKKSSSMVVGAGLQGTYVADLGDVVLHANETVLLRWKIDVTPADSDIVFSLFNGRCEDKKLRTKAKTLIDKRMVKGGGAGDVEKTFVVDKACTLLFCNTHSWIRPRTIKFTLQAYAI